MRVRRARLDLTPSSAAAYLKRRRRGGTQPKSRRQHRRRGNALDPDPTAVAAPLFVCDTTAVAVFTPGTPPVASGASPQEGGVAALASLPCGLSSAVTDDSLVCSICTEVLHAPVNGQACPHTFCATCLSTWVNRSARALCPLCRTPLAAPVPDADAAARLEKASVVCTCGARVILANARAHGATCTHVAIACAAVAAHGVIKGAAGDAAPRQAAPAVAVFTCPLCTPPSPSAAAQQLDASALVAHVLAAHGEDSSAAVCPLCAAAPWGDPSRVSRNWAAHVALRHVGRDGVPDAGGDLIRAAEEAVLQAVIARSLAEAGIGGAPGGSDAAARLHAMVMGAHDYDEDGDDGED